MSAFKGWKDTPEKIFGAPFNGGSIAAEISPELLGVGYIIGPRISAIMAAGGVLSYLVLIPLIKFFGETAAGAIAPGTIPIKDMAPQDRSRRLRPLHRRRRGGGRRHHQPVAFAADDLARHPGGLVGLRHGGRTGARRGGAAPTGPVDEICRCGMRRAGAGASGRAALHMNLVGAVLIVRVRFSVRHGFLAADRRDRLVLQPDFRHDRGHAAVDLPDFPAGRAGPAAAYYVTALSVGGIVCVAASNGGRHLAGFEDGLFAGRHAQCNKSPF